MLLWFNNASFKAFTTKILNFLTSNHSKNYFIYFNTSLHNTSIIKSLIFFTTSLKHSFFYSFILKSASFSLFLCVSLLPSKSKNNQQTHRSPLTRSPPATTTIPPLPPTSHNPHITTTYPLHSQHSHHLSPNAHSRKNETHPLHNHHPP